MARKVYYFNGGWLRPALGREGRVERRIRQALIAAGDRLVSTRELAEAAWPRKDMSREPHWRWLDARLKIERYAVRYWKRERPLLWRAIPELLERKRREPDD